MKNNSKWVKRLCCVGLVTSALALAGAGPVFADSPERYYDRDGHRDYRHDRRYWDRRFKPREHRKRYKAPRVIHRGKPRAAPRDRVRWYRDIVIVRPHGHWYRGYAHHYHDDDAYKWLAFTAITLGVLDFLNEAQQREHEAAQIAATTAPIGPRPATGAVALDDRPELEDRQIHGDHEPTDEDTEDRHHQEQFGERGAFLSFHDRPSIVRNEARTVSPSPSRTATVIERSDVSTRSTVISDAGTPQQHTANDVASIVDRHDRRRIGNPHQGQPHHLICSQ